MLELINQDRAQAGLPALRMDARLVWTARAKSQDMITNSYFGHESPMLGLPFDQFKAGGISYRLAAENLSGNLTVEKAHKTLMASTGHRANLLHPNFSQIGIGVVAGGPYGLMITQHFIAE